MSTEQKLSRRAFLKAGGAILVGVAGGTIFRATQQGIFSVGQGEAYAPWTDWQNDTSSGPVSLVRAAILASNPHNSQPWLFRITDHQIDVFADTTRQIGTIDPFLREMYIGLGSALENLMLAAQVEGYAANITYMPDASDSTFAASISLTRQSPAPSSLYDAIPHRHTNRLDYDVNHPVEQVVIDRLNVLNNDPELRVFWTTDPAARNYIGEQTIQATAALIADEQQSIDSHAWWRGSWDQLQRERDGITPDAGQGPALAALIKLLPDSDRVTADGVFLDQTRTRYTATAMGYGLIAVRDPMDNALRLRAGRLWQRIHLQATIDNLAMQPLSQILERADREKQLSLPPQFTDSLSEIIADPAYHAVMLFRFGYPTQPPTAAAPRRSVDAVLL
jgi:nitroreductase